MKTDRRFVATFMVFLICLASSISSANPAHQEGTLTVKVVWGDFNDPARDAVVYVQGYLERSSTLVSSVHPGWFEVSLKPGLYDVLVGESSTLPVCRRVEIKAGDAKTYTVKLEPDLEHLQN
jgi:hypothetical protein